jgi:hypothetical protein
MGAAAGTPMEMARVAGMRTPAEMGTAAETETETETATTRETDIPVFPAPRDFLLCGGLVLDSEAVRRFG